MIIFIGPAGAGKSVQGQMLSARHEWRWLSAGQLLRDTRDPELLAQMQTGELLDDDLVNGVMMKALARSKDMDHVILDGFPRHLAQAEWLITTQPEHEHSVDLIVVLEVPKSEIMRRLSVRGRAEDIPEVIEERLHIYRQEIYPILTYFTNLKVHVTHIDGTGTVGQVHDRIQEELVACSLV